MLFYQLSKISLLPASIYHPVLPGGMSNNLEPLVGNG
uniref:Uncharacterized protein n=1 Tax=Arundo donax TaxID=35708 RepID=A0A0A8XQR8_ARUDO